MSNLQKRKSKQPLIDATVETETEDGATKLVDKLIEPIVEAENAVLGSPQEEQFSKTSVVSPVPENEGKLTVKDKKEIIHTVAIAAGIEITPGETKEFLRTIATNSRASRNDFYQAAKAVLAAYKQRLDQESQQMMLEIRDDFVETVAESDKKFVEGVQETFRSIQEFSAESSRKSQANLANLYESLEDGSLFDF